MPQYGRITSYDSGKGAGTIVAEKGGVELPFGKSDLKRESQQPRIKQIYTYETVEIDGIQIRAVDLQRYS